MRILLLSGGVDSSALAGWVRPDLAYTIDYGQLAAQGEIRAASSICAELGLPHRVLVADCRSLGSGDLAGKPSLPLAPSSDWWPFRNQLLVTLAGMAALEDGGTELLLGSVGEDLHNSDGTQGFADALSTVMSAQLGGLIVSVPAVHLNTMQLVRRSGLPASVLAWTHSCSVGAFACGRCRGCNKRTVVFTELENLCP